jgi:hypothetical protein
MTLPLRCLALAAILAMWSCTGDDAPLPRSKMAEVLRDVHLAESWAGIAGPDSLRSTASRRNLDSLATYYHSIFAKHGLTQQEFSTAYTWYKAHPTDLDSVYARVLPMLNELEAKAATGAKH